MAHRLTAAKQVLRLALCDTSPKFSRSTLMTALELSPLPTRRTVTLSKARQALETLRVNPALLGVSVYAALGDALSGAALGAEEALAAQLLELDEEDGT